MTARFLVKSRHKTIWYARVLVPRDLRSLFGKNELRKSTRTENKRLAQTRALVFYSDCTRIFDYLRERVARKKKKNRREPSKGDNPYIDSYMSFTDDFGRKHEFDFSNYPNGAELEQKAYDKAKSESVLRYENLSFEEKKLIHGASTNEANVEVESKLSTTEVIESLKRERLKQINKPGKFNGVSESTINQELPRFEFWNAVLPEKISEITRAKVKEIASWLRYIPSRMTQKSLSPLQAVKIAEEKNVEGSLETPKSTYNKWATVLRAILSHAYQCGAHHEDLSHFIECPNAAADPDIIAEPFDNDDLKLLFDGASYGKHFKKASLRVSFEARFWIPLFGLFSGCRLEELAQLTMNDVKREGSMHFFLVGNQEFAADGKPKRIKNRNSIRPVPIHKVLLDIGFLEYLEHRRAGKDQSLFNLTRPSSGKFGGQFSKYFTRKSEGTSGYIERCGVTSSGLHIDGTTWRKSFHSLRHTVITALYQTDVSEEMIATTVGHKGVSFQTRRYKAASETDQLSKRYKVIQSLDYPAIDFASIRWSDHSSINSQ
jgi:integrase